MCLGFDLLSVCLGMNFGLGGSGLVALLNFGIWTGFGFWGCTHRF